MADLSALNIFNLQDYFPKRVIPIRSSKPTILSKFMYDRHISSRDLSQFIDIHPNNISAYLAGRKPLPESRKAELDKIVDVILKWEIQHDKKLNS